MTKANILNFALVIAVYNAEKYIGECLDSIINQTFPNWVVYCVDDCSSDNSLHILNEYAKKDNRIKILRNRENLGAAASRNAALNKITPNPLTWIYFIDSDDYISCSTIEIISKSIASASCKVDAVRLNFQRTTLLYSENKDVQKLLPFESVNYSIVSRDDYFRKYNVGGYTCHICVNSMLVNDKHASFPENQKILEDQVFSIPCFAQADNIIVIHRPLYYYYSNPYSLGRKMTGRRKYDVIRLINNIYPVLINLSDATRHYLFNDFLPSRLDMYMSMSIHSQTEIFDSKVYLLPSIKFFPNLKGLKSKVKYLLLFITGKL